MNTTTPTMSEIQFHQVTPDSVETQVTHFANFSTICISIGSMQVTLFIDKNVDTRQIIENMANYTTKFATKKKYDTNSKEYAELF